MKRQHNGHATRRDDAAAAPPATPLPTSSTSCIEDVGRWGATWPSLAPPQYYRVARIGGRRLNPETSALEYLVFWHGYDDSRATWEPWQSLVATTPPSSVTQQARRGGTSNAAAGAGAVGGLNADAARVAAMVAACDRREARRRRSDLCTVTQNAASVVVDGAAAREPAEPGCSRSGMALSSSSSLGLTPSLGTATLDPLASPLLDPSFARSVVVAPTTSVVSRLKPSALLASLATTRGPRVLPSLDKDGALTATILPRTGACDAFPSTPAAADGETRSQHRSLSRKREPRLVSLEESVARWCDAADSGSESAERDDTTTNGVAGGANAHRTDMEDTNGDADHASCRSSSSSASEDSAVERHTKLCAGAGAPHRSAGSRNAVPGIRRGGKGTSCGGPRRRGLAALLARSVAFAPVDVGHQTEETTIGGGLSVCVEGIVPREALGEFLPDDVAIVSHELARRERRLQQLQQGPQQRAAVKQQILSQRSLRKQEREDFGGAANRKDRSDNSASSGPTTPTSKACLETAVAEIKAEVGSSRLDFVPPASSDSGSNEDSGSDDSNSNDKNSGSDDVARYTAPFRKPPPRTDAAGHTTLGAKRAREECSQLGDRGWMPFNGSREADWAHAEWMDAMEVARAVERRSKPDFAVLSAETPRSAVLLDPWDGDDARSFYQNLGAPPTYVDGHPHPTSLPNYARPSDLLVVFTTREAVATNDDPAAAVEPGGSSNRFAMGLTEFRRHYPQLLVDFLLRHAFVLA